jgi:L-amino acid N-acyltransferase YncA
MSEGGAPSTVALRDAIEADLPAVTAIYGHHVRSGLGSFEEVSPPLADMARRYAEIRARELPYLAAVDASGAVLGFAYASPYRARSAYRFAVEDSIYIAAGHSGRGIGRALLAALIERCARAGYRQMVAVIGDSGNIASIALHERLGFRQAGLLSAVGFKHRRWVDSVLMQRALGPGSSALP